MAESGFDAEHKSEERSAHELSSCLLELSRLVRGIAFYPTGDPHLCELLDRTFAAFGSELERCGELQLCEDTDRIAIAGIDETPEGVHLEHLAGAIRAQQIAGISLAPGLQRDALEGLALLLASDPTELDAAAAFEPWDGQGIAIISIAQLVNKPEPEAAPKHDPERGPERESERESDSTEDTETLEVEAPSLPAEEPSVEALAEPQIGAADEHLKSIDEDPIRAFGDARSKRLQAQLLKLDNTSGDDYVEACSETLEAADALLALGLPDEVYRAVLVFTAHASGASRLDEDARANAQASLRELCDGTMLQFTISRACVAGTAARTRSSNARAEVRAAQVLLQLGEPAVPAVLERLRAARDPERLAQLSAVVIALGDRAVGPVSEELDASGRVPSRVAIQLAGELQNPKLVGPLMKVLHSGDPTLRNDAARSLVTIGRAASQVFIDALTSTDEDLAKVATHCLGRLGHARAVRPLISALERALQDKHNSLARDSMRALADIGDPRAVEPLAAIAARRDWLRRSRQHDLKLAAIGAIERIPGERACDALRELCAGADPRVAERAKEALGRRSAADSASLA